ncbi:hypothetical protein CPB84DRAFT_1397881 [Gymnopilus junonius]|uniref:DUF2786 domain-containing protein n=1 Tax=Gymnopilus junonius TaxID=109634 RepID=A0A9P5NLB6_GYMJU|nr:hypothetical protein CPB84DRAFT_1397881 [Gymnopilus junonius]
MARSDYGSESDEFESSTAEIDSSDSDDDFIAGSKRKRKPNIRVKGLAKAPPKPTYNAQVTESANDGLNASEKANSVEKADKKTIDKIRKAMDLANHHGTGEAEAKAAMRMAMKLMAAENITQADLIANETAEERSTRAGHSSVTIRSTKGTSVRHQRWYIPAAGAACEAFDVQYYTESYGSYLKYVFYGLADNTVAAALSFEMLHNQIENWALERKGELKGQIAGNSYRLGVARRVLKDSQDENHKAMKKAEEDEKRRVKEEEESRAAEIARLDMPVVAATVEEEAAMAKTSTVSSKIEDVPDKDSRHLLPYHADDSGDNHGQPAFNQHYDDGDDDDDMNADFDHRDAGAFDFDLDALEAKIRIKAEQVDPPLPTFPLTNHQRSPTVEPVVKAEPTEDESLKWATAIQLRTFKDNAKAIAQDYIKSTGQKLKKGRKLKSVQRDKTAFNKGWDDGKKVDLKRRGIDDEAWKECKAES